MSAPFIESFVAQFQIPLPAAKQLAAVVAQRCALLANRYGPEGIFTVQQMTAVETIGSQIGAVIIETFPSED